MNLPATWRVGEHRSDPSSPAARLIQTGTDAAATAWPAHAVVVLTHARPGQLGWALWCLVRGAFGIGRAPGLRFARAMGSGREGGFGIHPSLRHQGLIALFDQAEQAHAFAEQAQSVRSRLARCDEGLVAVLSACSARGSWDGMQMQPAVEAPGPGLPIAALTRATLRPSQALRFWGHTPGSERELAEAPGCQLAAGLGERPLVRQATFSLWDDTAAMTRYAQQGAHGTAARQALGEGWFREWMFVRFAPLRVQGIWHGRRFG